ncbi:MAG: very short patch repair endonuclease [Christensenellaceae bacterium]
MSRSPEITHKIMSAIKSKDTRPELALRKELWRRKLRYRKNYKRLPGKPDIVFPCIRLVVFCDGDFWHGHNWAIRGYGSLENELRRYSKEWAEKIIRNMQRDERINKELKDLGWKVIRIWESDIKVNVKRCGDIVEYVYWDIIRNSLANEEVFEEDV